MEMDEDGNVKEVGTSKAQESWKDDSPAKKRGGDKEVEKAHSKGKETNLKAHEESKVEHGSKKYNSTLGAKDRKLLGTYKLVLQK